MDIQKYVEPRISALNVSLVSCIAASYGDTNQAGCPLEVEEEYEF